MEIEKIHGKGCVVFWGRSSDAEPEHVSTAKTQDELTAAAFSKPASGDCIMAHLMRMSAILRINGAGKGDHGVQSAFLLSDYTGRLMEAEVREVDLFLACEHFIETNDDGFFPTISKLLKYVGKAAN